MMKRNLVVLGLALSLIYCLSALAAPATDGGSATTSIAQGQAVAITGTVAVDGNGRMMVGGYVIVPVTPDVPTVIYPGEVVIVVGLLQPDGRTIYADSITLYDDSTPLPPTTTPATIIALLPTHVWTPMPTRVWTPVPDGDTESATNCDREGQPVAQRIADAFNVPYETVIQMHCAGNGFGEITRAFLLQVKTDVSAWTYLQRHQDGEGWGQIIKDADVKPSDLAPGQIISRSNKCEDGNGPPGQCKKLDGEGNGHGNGNGNGDGEGNGHGNGNGNGHGKGH